MGIAIFLFIVGGAAIYWWHKDWLDHSQDNVIRAAAHKYSIEPALIKAVVWRESRFDARALGKAQEFGLMQLQEEAAREWAEAEHISWFVHEHCFDPGTNTLAGTWYLRKLLKRYVQTDNPVPYALADYNAGRGNVLKWSKGEAVTNSVAFLAQVGFPSTRAYIQDVTARYEYYRPLFQ